MLARVYAILQFAQVDLIMLSLIAARRCHKVSAQRIITLMCVRVGCAIKNWCNCLLIEFTLSTCALYESFSEIVNLHFKINKTLNHTQANIKLTTPEHSYSPTAHFRQKIPRRGHDSRAQAKHMLAINFCCREAEFMNRCLQDQKTFLPVS